MKIKKKGLVFWCPKCQYSVLVPLIQTKDMKRILCSCGEEMIRKYDLDECEERLMGLEEDLIKGNKK